MIRLVADKAIAIVASSNGVPVTRQPEVERLAKFIAELGCAVKISPCLYVPSNGFSAAAEMRAQVINEFYADDTVQAIFDISGGDAANQILEFIDYSLLHKYPKPYFGYSDLTVVLNALRKLALVPVCLFSPMTLVGTCAAGQQQYFIENFVQQGDAVSEINAGFLRGNELQGTIEGGNLRCLLKLAGTPYWPALANKILFLESYGGDGARLSSYLTQLRHMKVFEQVKGLLLGQFTQWEKESGKPSMEEIALEATKESGIPVAKTADIGHSDNSKALWLGSEINLAE